MFQFRAFPPYGYLIHRTVLRYCLSGFPHSEIPGSQLICSSPRLIAACRVLLRLLMPRHSPCALVSFTLEMISHFWFSNYAGSTEVLFNKIVFTLFKSSTIAVFKCRVLTRRPLLPCFFFFLCSVFKVHVPADLPVVENSGIEPLTS